MALTDNGNHPPPTSGNQDYNGTPFVDLPALGGVFVDSVFGERVRRVSNIGATANNTQQYGFNAYNADSTLMFFNTLSAGLNIRNPLTGIDVYTAQPVGLKVTECRWDMLNADAYYFPSGAILKRRNLLAQTTDDIFTFPATLQLQGGSVNFQSADGRYFVVKYNDTHHIWDSQTGTIYTGNIPTSGTGGYVGMVPSGRLVYGGGYAVTTLGQKFFSFAINHGAQTVDTVGVMNWDCGGDHGVAMSCSDGKDYLACFNTGFGSAGSEGCYVLEMNIDREAMTADQQGASAKFVLPLHTNEAGNGHMSSVYVGANQNNFFLSNEGVDDGFNQAVGTWRPYKSEIIAINPIAGTIRRLTHHRSRGLPGVYETQPRASCSPRGDMVQWSSNVNDSTPAGFADLFQIENPLGVLDAGGTALYESEHYEREPVSNPTTVSVWN